MRAKLINKSNIVRERVSPLGWSCNYKNAIQAGASGLSNGKKDDSKNVHVRNVFFGPIYFDNCHVSIGDEREAPKKIDDFEQKSIKIPVKK